MATRITATELARNLSDILNRVKYRGEKFSVERKGEVVAIIEPAPKSKQITWGEFLELYDKIPKPDPGFWDDVEEAHRLGNEIPKSQWDS
jgi:antitoxin (DNA-binding transcriptional repressor) of toxin-antitoxin stability system